LIIRNLCSTSVSCDNHQIMPSISNPHEKVSPIRTADRIHHPFATIGDINQIVKRTNFYAVVDDKILSIYLADKN
jgi:hypothetical protein